MKLITLLSASALLASGLCSGADYTTSSNDSKRAMEFLYNSMPLPDRASYPESFFLENVESSLRARAEMPWGDSVPEREFKHFVLPVRVNNEALDMSRPELYRILKPRVEHLSMRDAILEVNHWCHERVTYQPSDGRTSGPLSCMSQAIGRCGEESTFAVAALRAVGIPARQVYTPRWAHTDDNHAWVEAWADGKWHFIGACEPEPVLDLAWFNAPASRAMLMTTNVLGRYDGPEEQLRALPEVTTINVTSNYAPVAPLKVKIVEANGKPAEGAKAKFCIYNYADFYPVAAKNADSNGEVELTAGLGDMVVWASDGSNFGFIKARPDSTQIYTLTLDRRQGDPSRFELDITPPAPGANIPYVSEEQRRINDERFSHEDSIRHAYTSTFLTDADARKIAATLSLDPDSTAAVLSRARGNSRILANTLAEMHSPMREKALRLLSVVTEKDLRDINIDALFDHLNFTPGDCLDPFEAAYILNPRIETEAITPWRSYFMRTIPASEQKKYRKNPTKLISRISKGIADDTHNPQRLIIDPRAAWQQQTADVRSKGILFVAMARTFGIPARIDPITSLPQYADAQRIWHDVNFETISKQKESTDRSTLRVDYTQAGRLANPKYYHHFSILKMDGGFPSQLDFEDGWGVDEINDMKAGLAEGNYLVISGQRLADGGVLASGEFFNIRKGEDAVVPLTLRQDSTKVQVIGSLDAETLWDNLDGKRQSILSHTGRGYYVLGLVRPGDEPTSHTLRDIALMRSEFEEAGIPMLLLFDSKEAAGRFDFAAYPEMPKKSAWGVDVDSKVKQQLTESLNLTETTAPIFVVADSFNRVVYISQGYTVGLGHRLLRLFENL